MNRHSDSQKDMLENDMHDIWYLAVNETLQVFSYTRSIQLKDIQTNG